MSQEFRVQTLSYPELLPCGAYLWLLINNSSIFAARTPVTPHCSSFAPCWHRAAISPGAIHAHPHGRLLGVRAARSVVFSRYARG